MLDPDELKDGISQLIDPEVRNNFYFFIAHYVRKVYADHKIVKDMKNSPGRSFLGFITDSDIAYVLTVVKNNRDMWDEKLDKKEGDTDDVAQGSGT